MIRSSESFSFIVLGITFFLLKVNPYIYSLFNLNCIRKWLKRLEKSMRFQSCYGLKVDLPKCYKSWLLFFRIKSQNLCCQLQFSIWQTFLSLYSCPPIHQSFSLLILKLTMNVGLYKKKIEQRQSRQFRSKLQLVCCYCKKCLCSFILVGFLNSEKHSYIFIFVISTLVV